MGKTVSDFKGYVTTYLCPYMALQTLETALLVHKLEAYQIPGTSQKQTGLSLIAVLIMHYPTLGCTQPQDWMVY